MQRDWNAPPSETSRFAYCGLNQTHADGLLVAFFVESMYGLINKAIRDMILEGHGEELWTRVRVRAVVDAECFEAMEPYPDGLTKQLIAAASEELQQHPHDLMRAFGEFWVIHTAAEGYGQLMELAGSSLPEFLQNLDDLHARVGVNFPSLVPPSFETEEPAPGTIHLHYHSQREGLAPMVIGLVEGLGDRFDTPVDVDQLAWRSEGDDHDVFEVRFDEPQTPGS
jgi:hypothetical protein